jgi:hypothetical protein
VFKYKGRTYKIDESKWNTAKANKFYKKTGLSTFREQTGNRNLVFYNPSLYEIRGKNVEYLKYVGPVNDPIEQPLNCSSLYRMFEFDFRIKHLNLENWEISKVVCFDEMCQYCYHLKSVVLNVKQISKACTVHSMFKKCTLLKDVSFMRCKLPENFSADDMFYGCDNLHSKFPSASEDDILRIIILNGSEESMI